MSGAPRIGMLPEPPQDGSHVKYNHEVWGYNSRLDELQAALHRAKLPGLDEWNERHRPWRAEWVRSADAA